MCHKAHPLFIRINKHKCLLATKTYWLMGYLQSLHLLISVPNPPD